MTATSSARQSSSSGPALRNPSQATRSADRGIAKFRRTLQWSRGEHYSRRPSGRVVDVDRSLHLELGLVLCV